MLTQYLKRNTSIELLRLWFMLMIVLIHAYGHGCGLDYDYLYSLGGDPSTAHHLALLSLGKCGVTGFMFISGYYGITLRWNKIGSMVAMLLFYLFAVGLATGSGIKGMALTAIHPWDGWWFISSYLVICVLSPVVNKGIEAIGQKALGGIVLFMLFYEYVGQFVSLANSHDTIFLLTIFLTARYIRLYITPPHQPRNSACRYAPYAALASGLLLCVVPVALTMLGWPKLNKLFVSNNNILLLIFTSAMVVWLDGKKWRNRYVNYLAASTLAIYLITEHGGVRRPLDEWLLGRIMNEGDGFLFVLVVAFVCLVADKVREAIFSLAAWSISKLKEKLKKTNS